MIQTSYKSAFLDSGLSYADIMYNELTRYYSVSIIDSQSIAQGLDKEYLCYKIEMIAKKGADSYAKIISYIDKLHYLTIKREYYSLSGKELKEINYGEYVIKGENVSSFKLEVDNILNPNQKTSAYLWNLKKLAEIPEKYFSLNFLRTWQPTVQEEKP